MIDPPRIVEFILLRLQLLQLLPYYHFVVQRRVLRTEYYDWAKACNQPTPTQQHRRAVKDYIHNIALNIGVYKNSHEYQGEGGQGDRYFEEERDELIEGLVFFIRLIYQLLLNHLIHWIGAQLPFRTKLLNYFYEMTPFRYFSFSLYWFVLNPYVLVRQGITIKDQLVVGICLLLMRSLYLSVLGKNYYLIQSFTSL